MNEMVERVAKAIAKACEPNWDGYEEMARAAIEAMKGATATMKEAGAHSSLTLMASYGGDGAFYYVSEENAGEIFDQMIDAALKE